MNQRILKFLMAALTLLTNTLSPTPGEISTSSPAGAGDPDE